MFSKIIAILLTISFVIISIAIWQKDIRFTDKLFFNGFILVIFSIFGTVIYGVSKFFDNNGK